MSDTTSQAHVMCFKEALIPIPEIAEFYDLDGILPILFFFLFFLLLLLLIFLFSKMFRLN